MTEAATINAVMRALADPTRRAVFERIVRSDEITVVELTRGSGVTQGAISQHLKSLKQAGLVAERPEGRNVFYRARAGGPRAARRLDEPLRRLLARAVRQPPNPAEGNRSMNDAALKSGTQDIVVDEVFPHAPETIWKTLTTGELIARWMDDADRVRAREGQALHVPDDAGRRVGRCHSLRGAGGDAERTPRLRLERRTRGQTSDTARGWTRSSR